MICPHCNEDAKCISSREHEDGRMRRYECDNGHRFSTMEQVAIFPKGGPGSRWHFAKETPPEKSYKDGVLECIAKLQELV